MSQKLFETALGIAAPWFVAGTDFDVAARKLTIQVDFVAGSRFSVAGVDGEHPVHDTVAKQLRHLNFFQHECYLEVRVPRVKLPSGDVRLAEPDWFGKLAGFTLLFEALILLMAQQMPFRAVSRLVGVSVHRVMAICNTYVDLAVAQADYSEVKRLAIDETSKARGHDYVTITADAERRAVICVTEGKDAKAVETMVADFRAHGGDPEAVQDVSIDMSAAFIKGVTEQLPNAQITFDKFHVVQHASDALTETRRAEQKTDPSLKGMRWKLVTRRDNLKPEDRADLDDLLKHVTTKRTARAWVYQEQLREILKRKQINVMRELLTQWCTNVMRSKVTHMKTVAAMIRDHMEGIVAWARTRQTNGFLEAINGLFQAAKRKARGYVRLQTIRMVIFLIAGKLDFSTINPHFR